MRVILCDVCKNEIRNAPIISIRTSSAYPEVKARNDPGAILVTISGSVNSGYHGYSSPTTHEMEICFECAKYLEHAMQDRKRQSKEAKVADQPIPSIVPSE